MRHNFYALILCFFCTMPRTLSSAITASASAAQATQILEAGKALVGELGPAGLALGAALTAGSIAYNAISNTKNNHGSLIIDSSNQRITTSLDTIGFSTELRPTYIDNSFGSNTRAQSNIISSSIITKRSDYDLVHNPSYALDTTKTHIGAQVSQAPAANVRPAVPSTLSLVDPLVADVQTPNSIHIMNPAHDIQNMLPAKDLTALKKSISYDNFDTGEVLSTPVIPRLAFAKKPSVQEIQHARLLETARNHPESIETPRSPTKTCNANETSLSTSQKELKNLYNQSVKVTHTIAKNYGNHGCRKSDQWPFIESLKNTLQIYDALNPNISQASLAYVAESLMAEIYAHTKIPQNMLCEIGEQHILPCIQSLKTVAQKAQSSTQNIKKIIVDETGLTRSKSQDLTLLQNAKAPNTKELERDRQHINNFLKSDACNASFKQFHVDPKKVPIADFSYVSTLADGQILYESKCYPVGTMQNGSQLLCYQVQAFVPPDQLGLKLGLKEVIINMNDLVNEINPEEEKPEEKEDQDQNDIDQVDANKIKHIKQSKHNWKKLVPGENFDEIKKIIKDVMKTGTERARGIAKAKTKTINGETVEVTYQIVDGVNRISNA